MLQITRNSMKPNQIIAEWCGMTYETKVPGIFFWSFPMYL